MKQRLDKTLFQRKLVSSRSSAENFIKLGLVEVNGKTQNVASTLVDDRDDIKVTAQDRYVSRAGLKLASVAQKLDLNFVGKTVLDVGSSTGGFTDFALQHGAVKVLAVDVGTNQLHPTLHGDPRIELHEQTDIRKFVTSTAIDIVVIDVSFISLRDILPSVAKLTTKNTQIVAMVKPQFEAGREQINKGVIKNDHMRRDILKDFEHWARQTFKVQNKADSEVAGAKGNLERFYMLSKI
ncbi:TlyA family RNA methyltransferase [bacterium]|nr:TlyA family RNA methyltransferase [bacterium]NBX97625.1 TlyA family RNA methyltransferase [bacterium]NDC94770.1 TlyA family RNA methyltransferase [bacterium]NDD84556.1 TlyA family RNA methyltransferase [bacterium]NDG30494.1 TlyA family RNA methyltransferase [bacterium]